MITRVNTLPSASSASQKSFTDRRLVQLLWGVFVSTFLPYAVSLQIWPAEAANYDGLRNSAIVSCVAFLAGWVWYRRLIRYPGVQELENVLTAFIVTFAISAAILPIFRLDYNRTYLVMSFVFVLVGFAGILVRRGLNQHPNYHLVPFGGINRLLQIGKAHWKTMADPRLPPPDSAGIVVDLRADLPNEWQRMIADAVLAGIPVFHIKQIEEALSGRVDIEHLSENHFGLLEPSPEYRKLKHIGDFLISLLLLPFLAVPLLLVAIAIKLDSPGPVFFRQRRIGFRGQVFAVYKFRTMRNAADVASRADARSAAMTQTDDARITRLGKFLRRYRIDELSQIINVLKGEMSWIGPRPEAVALSEWYLSELPFYQYRHVLRPGITGWAQVNQGHVTDLVDAHDKLRFDLYYIKYFSIWIDLLVLIRTIRIVISGFGAK